ncbi:MAG: 2-phosphosulfolactate phosphatase [Granulosicoccus sp.]
MNKVEVCYSPSLFKHFSSPDSIVVVADIFRATSAIVTAFDHGARSMVPVSSVLEAKRSKDAGMLAGGERDGMIVEGFDFGNSPFSYINDDFKGKDIALTTTNGTKAINMASEASDAVLIGSFLNLSAVSDWILKNQKDVVILCAGWKNRFNMEDSLYAGALTDSLLSSGQFDSDCDSANAARLVYRSARRDLLRFLSTCSHRKRLAHLNLEKDVAYCLQVDVCNVVPILNDGRIVPAV